MPHENLYHLLSFLPATEAWEMTSFAEAQAQRLMASGKLRVNAEHERNFVRHGEMTFSARELTDPLLQATTRERVARHVAPADGPDGIHHLWDHLRGELKKARGVSAEKEIRVARVLVQSAHPAVIELLLRSGTEVFVSYSYNVADLMAVHEWETNGSSSGLQATDGAGTAVFVSAGGDPFFEGEQKTYTTDGFPALARMVVIAGQELGHFADLRRTAGGIIGRHSTDINHSYYRAAPTARAARESDQQNLVRMSSLYAASGLPWLLRMEKNVDFYHRRLRYSPPWMIYQALRFVAWSRFILASRKHALPTRFHTLPAMRGGTAVAAYLADMTFNLAPEHDVYRNPDPLVEEAISIIEAVARVPQQVHKWGHLGVKAAWPGLYPFYYARIIPACEAAVGRTFATEEISILQSLIIKLRRRLRPRPGYYP